MEPLITFLSSVGIFAVGLALRLLAFVAIIALLSVPILFVLGGVEAIAKLRRWALGVTNVGTLSWRPGLYYAPGHMWVAPATARGARVGVDDLAQRLLPSVSRVTLPDIGARVRQGTPVASFKTDGHDTSVLSPVTGTVTAVNARVRRDPSILHRDPYVRGWLFEVSPTEPGYLRLPRADAARQWFNRERARFERMIEAEVGFAMADGGELVLPAHKLMQSGQWQRITDAFLGVTETPGDGQTAEA